MEIIDLFNKIANGEEVPKKIKYKGWLFSFDRQPCDYYCEEYGNLFEYLINEKRTIEFLNEEVEIIEEENKIPEKIGLINYCEDPATSLIHIKVDEIIDYLQYLKSKGE